MNVILRSFRVTITAVKNNKHYIFRVCPCTLSYLACHEERMLPFMSPVACLAFPYFFTLSHKRNDCRKKKLLNRKCLF